MIRQATPGVLSRVAFSGLFTWYRAGVPTFLMLWQQLAPQDHPSPNMRDSSPLWFCVHSPGKHDDGGQGPWASTS